jgi:DNA topoisomerase-3
VFDNAKVSDHFAIIPTLQAPQSLSEIEAKLYDLVVKRFLAVFYPPRRVHGHHPHHARSTAGPQASRPTARCWSTRAGWRSTARRRRTRTPTWCRCSPASGAHREVRRVALKTKPPARYTEATLLSAMEGAGKLIDDDELREAMAEKGLGTPATRAQVIEGLILEKYMLREGRELIPTAKAFQLMTLLRGLGVEDLTKPELTGNWEYQLAEMEHGRLSRGAFMKDIAKMAERIVKKAKEYDRDTIPGDYATLKAPCPNCGGVVKENYRRFTCDACEFSITKIPGARSFELPEVERFLVDKKIGPLEGFRSKAGWPFSAELKLVFDDEIKNWKLEFDFGEDAKAQEEGEPVDFSAQQSLGACPKCQGPGLRARQQLPLRARGGRPRDLRLQDRQDHPDASRSRTSRSTSC